MLKYCNISVEESYPPSLPPTLPPSLKDELEAKIEKIRTGAKKKIKELEDLIVKNKSESDKTIRDLQNKIDCVYKLTTLTPQGQKQMIGEKLFPMVEKVNEKLAAKVTGMLLELENLKLVRMLEDGEYFIKEVDKALNTLKTSPHCVNLKL